MTTELLDRPVAKKSASPKRDDTTVKVDRDVATDAYMVAKGLGMSLAEYATMAIRERLSRDANDQAKRMMDKYPPPEKKP